MFMVCLKGAMPMGMEGGQVRWVCTVGTYGGCVRWASAKTQCDGKVRQTKKSRHEDSKTHTGCYSPSDLTLYGRSIVPGQVDEGVEVGGIFVGLPGP